MKLKKLREVIRGYGKRLALAFSGGVDSSFLLAVAMEEAEEVIAITVNSDFVAQSEIDSADKMAKELDAQHEILHASFKDIEGFAENPPDRCYYCKRSIFNRILSFARERGIDTVMEGSNAGDQCEHRPGLRAIEELGVASPLAESGLNKEEIRKLSREIGLSSWDSPDNTCLATRIRIGEEITREKLEMVEEAEEFMRDLRFGFCRVRHHGNIARIEVSPEKIPELLDERIRDRIDRKFREIGFMYVTADMTGYSRGSMGR
jgi:uncharacterized protein